MRRISKLTVALALCAACRSRPAEHEPSPRPPAAGQCSAEALPIAPLVVQTSNGGEPLRFDLAVDGVVRAGDRVVGRISGSCLLDAHGGVLRSVDAQGAVSGIEGERIGSFEASAGRRDPDGKPVEGELLVEPDPTRTDPDSMIGLASEGDLFLAGDGREGVWLPAGVTGEGRRSAPRTALLLYVGCGALSGPGG